MKHTPANSVVYLNLVAIITLTSVNRLTKGNKKNLKTKVLMQRASSFEEGSFGTEKYFENFIVNCSSSSRKNVDIPVQEEFNQTFLAKSECRRP